MTADALVVAFRPEHLEVEGAVAQPARTVAEIAINRAAIDHMGELFGQIFESCAQSHLEARRVQDGGDQFRVAALGHRLMGVGEIGIVKIEAKRQAFEDRRGQPGGIEAPLLAGIAAEEGLVEFGPDHAESLLLEIGRLRIFRVFEATNAAASSGRKVLRKNWLMVRRLTGSE